MDGKRWRIFMGLPDDIVHPRGHLRGHLRGARELASLEGHIDLSTASGLEGQGFLEVLVVDFHAGVIV